MAGCPGGPMSLGHRRTVEGVLLGIPVRGAASHKEKPDCARNCALALAAGWQGGHGGMMGIARHRGTSIFLFGGRGGAMKMFLTNLFPLGKKPCWRSGRTASRQLIELKLLKHQSPCTSPGGHVGTLPNHGRSGIAKPRVLRESNPVPQRSLC